MSKNAKIFWTVLAIGLALVVINIDSETDRENKFNNSKMGKELRSELRELQRIKRGY